MMAMIDWDRIAELQDEVGEDSFAEVVEMFFEEVEEVLTSLVVNDQDALKGGLHFLKGAALNIGMSEMSGLCRDAEHTLMESGPDGVDFAQIQSVFKSAQAELRQILD